MMNPSPNDWQTLHPHTYERLASVLLRPLSMLSGPWPCIVEIGRGRTSDPRYQSTGRLRPEDNYWVFQFTTGGRGELRHGRTSHDCEPGTGMLFRANDRTVDYHYPASAHEPWEYLWVSFAGSTACTLARALVAEAGPVLRLDAAAHLLRPLEDVLEGAPSDRIQGSNGARLLFELLAGLREEAMRNASVLSDRGALIREAESVLLAGASDPELGISSVARRLNVSREHLSRAFRSERGLSPRQWLEHLRVEHAGHLLRETRLSVKEVAATAGFGTVGALIAAVRRRHGTTPGRWRSGPGLRR